MEAEAGEDSFSLCQGIHYDQWHQASKKGLIKSVQPSAGSQKTTLRDMLLGA